MICCSYMLVVSGLVAAGESRYGVLLFEMLTGDLPYYHKNKKKMLDSIKLAKKPKFPKYANASTLRHDVPLATC